MAALLLFFQLVVLLLGVTALAAVVFSRGLAGLPVRGRLVAVQASLAGFVILRMVYDFRARYLDLKDDGGAVLILVLWFLAGAWLGFALWGLALGLRNPGRRRWFRPAVLVGIGGSAALCLAEVLGPDGFGPGGFERLMGWWHGIGSPFLALALAASTVLLVLILGRSADGPHRRLLAELQGVFCLAVVLVGLDSLAAGPLPALAQAFPWGLQSLPLSLAALSVVFLRAALGAPPSVAPAARDIRQAAPVRDLAVLVASDSRLSPREKDCLTGALAGDGNKEIAARLGISEGTVKGHLFQAYRKLGIRNRIDLINGRAWAPNRTP